MEEELDPLETDVKLRNFISATKVGTYTWLLSAY